MKNNIYFEVIGAGQIRMSESPHHFCGGRVGFSFGVQWGKYGYTGGVISREEAKKMAEFILQKCSEITESEQEEYIRVNQQIKYQSENSHEK